MCAGGREGRSDCDCAGAGAGCHAPHPSGPGLDHARGVLLVANPHQGHHDGQGHPSLVAPRFAPPSSNTSLCPTLRTASPCKSAAMLICVPVGEGWTSWASARIRTAGGGSTASSMEKGAHAAYDPWTGDRRVLLPPVLPPLVPGSTALLFSRPQRKNSGGQASFATILLELDHMTVVRNCHPMPHAKSLLRRRAPVAGRHPALQRCGRS